MYGPWEDKFGPSFFARAAQVRFLEEVDSHSTLGLTKPSGFTDALDGLRLGSHWDDSNGYYQSIRNVSGYDPNADVIMACVYGSIPCTDPKLLATAAQLRGAFDLGGPAEYPINRKDDERGLGPLIGHYPDDTYDGNTSDITKSHPWAVCTANFAQLYFCLAKAFRAGERVAFDKLTQQFFNQLQLNEGIVNEPKQVQAIADALLSAGDKMLKDIVFHSDNYHISEQFDATTGFEKSVRDLTWSYAAYLSATRKWN